MAKHDRLDRWPKIEREFITKREIITKIERLSLRSFRGEHLSDNECEFMSEMFEAFPKEYGEINDRIRSEEVERIRSFKL